jgi:hypothetical protein
VTVKNEERLRGVEVHQLAESSRNIDRAGVVGFALTACASPHLVQNCARTSGDRSASMAPRFTRQQAAGRQKQCTHEHNLPHAPALQLAIVPLQRSASPQDLQSTDELPDYPTRLSRRRFRRIARTFVITNVAFAAIVLTQTERPRWPPANVETLAADPCVTCSVTAWRSADTRASG